MTDTKHLKDEELQQVSGGFIPIVPAGALSETEINDLLRGCGDLAYARQYRSVLWANINYAQAQSMNELKLNGINNALEALNNGLNNEGLSQEDHSYIENCLNQCKRAMEFALSNHIM